MGAFSQGAFGYLYVSGRRLDEDEIGRLNEDNSRRGRKKKDVEEGGERGGGGVGGKGVSQADSKRRSPGAVWNLLKMIHSLR